jgi:RNA polymerase sigma factor (TIGR02999 family)
MTDVTRILSAIDQGDSQAAEQLLPLVYDELRRLAAQKLSHEKPGQTLQATALVHEAYLRLVAPGETKQWNSRGHFFGAAAEAMRRILVELARRKDTLKYGGNAKQHNLNDAQLVDPRNAMEIMEVSDALDALADTDQEAAELVKLRYFVGLTAEESAKILGISTRKSHYLWAYARSWLRHEISRR